MNNIIENPPEYNETLPAVSWKSKIEQIHTDAVERLVTNMKIIVDKTIIENPSRNLFFDFVVNKGGVPSNTIQQNSLALQCYIDEKMIEAPQFLDKLKEVFYSRTGATLISTNYQETFQCNDWGSGQSSHYTVKGIRMHVTI